MLMCLWFINKPNPNALTPKCIHFHHVQLNNLNKENPQQQQQKPPILITLLSFSLLVDSTSDCLVKLSGDCFSWSSPTINKSSQCQFPKQISQQKIRTKYPKKSPKILKTNHIHWTRNRKQRKKSKIYDVAWREPTSIWFEVKENTFRFRRSGMKGCPRFWNKSRWFHFRGCAR